MVNVANMKLTVDIIDNLVDVIVLVLENEGETVAVHKTDNVYIATDNVWIEISPKE